MYILGTLKSGGMGTGNVTLSESNLMVNEVILGESGLGYIRQESGDVTINTTLSLGASETGAGHYQLESGKLSVSSINRGTGIPILDLDGGHLLTTHIGFSVTNNQTAVHPGTDYHQASALSIDGNYRQGENGKSVSYTHLPLPTIYSV